MAQQLFRSEVRQAHRASRPGGICLTQPLSLWLLTAFAFIAASVIALLLVFGSYARRASVSGRLVPTQGLATVLAPAAGVVGELRLVEGARVAAGQVLAVIAVANTSIANGASSVELEDSLRARRMGLESAQLGQQRALAVQSAGFAAQLTAARGELAQLEAQIGTREQQVRISDEKRARLRELHAKQYVSLAELQQQESTVLDHLGALQELQRQASVLKRDILQLRQSLDELPGQRQAVAAGTQRDLALLAQERVQIAAPGAVTITAPLAGVVATQIVKAGQSVQQGQPLFTVLPGEGRLEAELLVPSRAAGFIAPGDHVLLRYQAYPYQKFGHQQGLVASVSRSALAPNELGALLGTAGSGQPLYRISVTLADQAIRAYGKAEALKPGMLLDADILGERRRLVEWLFEPLYSLRGRLGES